MIGYYFMLDRIDMNKKNSVQDFTDCVYTNIYYKPTHLGHHILSST